MMQEGGSGQDLVHSVLAEGEWDRVKEIISKTPSLVWTSETYSGMTFAHAALSRVHKRSLEILNILLDKILEHSIRENVDVTRIIQSLFCGKNNHVESPLHVSACLPDVEPLIFLLEHAPNQKTLYSKITSEKYLVHTPLESCLSWGNVSVLDCLLRTIPEGLRFLDAMAAEEQPNDWGMAREKWHPFVFGHYTSLAGPQYLLKHAFSGAVEMATTPPVRTSIVYCRRDLEDFCKSADGVLQYRHVSSRQISFSPVFSCDNYEKCKPP
jgi:hypothetical protein